VTPGEKSISSSIDTSGSDQPDSGVFSPEPAFYFFKITWRAASFIGTVHFNRIVSACGNTPNSAPHFRYISKSALFRQIAPVSSVSAGGICQSRKRCWRLSAPQAQAPSGNPPIPGIFYNNFIRI
jgi:hypothetical protein